MKTTNNRIESRFTTIENFSCSLIFIQIFPVFVPFIAEYFHSNDLKRTSFDLCISIYFFTSGVITNKLISFSVNILMGVILAFSYGSYTFQSAFPFYDKWETYIFLGLSFLQITERWQRHVNSDEPFLLFKQTRL